MKKFKLLVSLTLVLTLIISVIVVAPVNAGAVKTTKAVSGAEVKTYTSVSGDYNVFTDSELIAALYEISQKESGSYTIALQADITHTGGYSMNKNTTTIIGNGHTINFNGLGQGLRVYSGAVLNLGQGENDSLTLCGDGEIHNEKNDPKIPDNDNPGMLHINGSASVCNMNSGVTIKNHRGNNYLGGGVTVESGTFNMNGGTIDRCGIDGGAVCYGGGVAVYGKGKFVMNGGTISNCYALSDYVHDPSQYYNGADNFEQLGYIFKTAMGGGVFVTGESTFIMNDGTITGNKSTRRGGGVCVSASLSEGFGNVKSKVVINGGTISSNESNVGGGIYVSGQELPCCAAISFNAIVSGTVEVENITGAGNKTSARAKKELLLTGDGETTPEGFNMNGGTVTDNTANVAGGGVEIHAVKEAATLKNADVENNTANYTSGLIKDTNDVDGYFHFKENGCGGGILVGYNNSNVTVENCTVSNNSSEENGGGVALVDAKPNPTTIKDSTIRNNESNDRGAGVFYDATSKLNMCGADIVQDNMYDNHLNNVNVLSTDNPIYVTGSLEGSKIGLSDPRLWDDNKTDAEAPDDGSAELLTNGYKAKNPDVHPSKYFTSDHDTWIVDYGEKKAVQGPEIGRTYTYTAKTYNAISRTKGSKLAKDTSFAVKAKTFSSGKADTRQKIYDEITARYKEEYKENPKQADYYYDPISGSNIQVHLYSPDMVHIKVDGSYILAKVSDQQSVEDGHLALVFVSGYLDEAEYSSECTEETVVLNNPISSDSEKISYNDIGQTVSKTVILKSTEQEDIQYETTTTDYTNEVRLVRRKTPIKFHTNNPTVTDETTRNNELFRVYKADKDYTTEDGTYDLKDGGVEEFYNIPKFAEDDYVFAGWYTVADNDDNDKSKAFEFNTAVPSDVEDVYAHWIPVGEVRKDANDDKELPSSMNGKYKGFEMFGVQIRPEANFDSNYGDVKPGGLRFIASISEDLLENIKDVHEDNKIEYGFVSAAEKTVNTVVDGFNIDKNTYKLQYNGENVNGVDTTQKVSNANNFRYITNVDCTSQKGGYGTKVKEDHRNFTNYRLATYVVTYNDDGTNKDKNVAARAYLRYTDANGLLRTFYNDYNGTNFYGGCSTNYTDVEKMATNTKTVQ